MQNEVPVVSASHGRGETPPFRSHPLVGPTTLQILATPLIRQNGYQPPFCLLLLYHTVGCIVTVYSWRESIYHRCLPWRFYENRLLSIDQSNVMISILGSYTLKQELTNALIIHAYTDNIPETPSEHPNTARVWVCLLLRWAGGDNKCLITSVPLAKRLSTRWY